MHNKIFNIAFLVIVLTFTTTNGRRHSTQTWYPYGFYHTDADLIEEEVDHTLLHNYDRRRTATTSAKKAEVENRKNAVKNVKNVIHRKRKRGIPFVSGEIINNNNHSPGSTSSNSIFHETLFDLDGTVMLMDYENDNNTNE